MVRRVDGIFAFSRVLNVLSLLCSAAVTAIWFTMPQNFKLTSAHWMRWMMPFLAVVLIWVPWNFCLDLSSISLIHWWLSRALAFPALLSEMTHGKGSQHVKISKWKIYSSSSLARSLRQLAFLVSRGQEFFGIFWGVHLVSPARLPLFCHWCWGLYFSVRSLVRRHLLPLQPLQRLLRRKLLPGTLMSTRPKLFALQHWQQQNQLPKS